MANESEREYIENLIRHTRESIQFFSNQWKPERERSVCAALLRCLGIKFLPKEIRANNSDPPDVIFKSARFELTELYDKTRKRNAEYWERLKELERAKSISETLVPVYQPTPISYEELSNEIVEALSSKFEKYGKDLCSTLDALIYVGLPNRFLDIRSEIPEYVQALHQGWRSMSFVMPPFAHIAFCQENEPQFLLSLCGKTKQEWKSPDGFFDLT
jgi:hypothetical protein